MTNIELVKSFNSFFVSSLLFMLINYIFKSVIIDLVSIPIIIKVVNIIGNHIKEI